MQVISEFRSAMERAGIPIEAEIIPDGKLHRVRAEGDGAESKNAWYVLHLDGRPVGRFGSWRLGISQGWAADAAGGELTPAEREALDRRIREAQEGRGEERKDIEREARRRAAYIWGRSALATEDHLYLTVKRVKAHGIRLYKGSLVVPLLDVSAALQSLQFIAPDGKKTFLSHGRVEGCFCGLGKVPAGQVGSSGHGQVGAENCPSAHLPICRIWIAEGYATGATVHEVMGEPVAVAFHAGNLRAVAMAIRAKLPWSELVIAADDDRWTPGNPGLTKAMEAAGAVGARVAVPYFADVTARPTDWNDLFRLRGGAEARARLLRAV